MVSEAVVTDEKSRAMSISSIDNEKGQHVGQSAEWIDTVAERAYGTILTRSLAREALLLT
jgi:hypothetical protein